MAAATQRTTVMCTLPFHATTLTRPASPPPRAAVPSHAAGGNASDVSVDDLVIIASLLLSSLLRDDGIRITAQRNGSSSSGRQGSSGRPRRADLIPTGSLTLPLASGPCRAAQHHRRRHSARARLLSLVMYPRVAPATLLSSSSSPQLGRRMTNGRAGIGRAARNRCWRGRAWWPQAADTGVGSRASAAWSRKGSISVRADAVAAGDCPNWECAGGARVACVPCAAAEVIAVGVKQVRCRGRTGGW